jgi:integrase
MTPPSGVKARARVLSREELISLWLAAEELGTRHGLVVQLLILNGQRLVEDAAMEWGELDLAEGRWNLPAARTKNGLPHIVPLGPQSMRIIQGQPRTSSAFVLAGPKGKYPKGWSDAKVKLEDATLRILRKRAAERGEDPDDVRMAHWQLHDLRRTLATGMPELGVTAEVVEAVLNHIQRHEGRGGGRLQPLSIPSRKDRGAAEVGRAHPRAGCGA